MGKTNQTTHIFNQISVELINRGLSCRNFRYFHLFLLFLALILFDFLGYLITGCFMVRPIPYLALLTTIPNTLALRAPLKRLFLAFLTLKSVDEPFHSIVGIQIGQPLNLLFLGLIHALFQSSGVFLGNFLPVSIIGYSADQYGHLLYYERVGDQMRGHGHE
jgi:hypothetical protein